MFYDKLIINFQVCISSLFFNNKQMFFGPNNDLPNFSMDQNVPICSNDTMKWSSIIIKNGTVASSECKGLSYK